MRAVSGVSGWAVILVAVLATFCLAALALHLIIGAGGYLKIKFGPFIFEYGTEPELRGGKPAGSESRQGERESGDSGVPVRAEVQPELPESTPGQPPRLGGAPEREK